jgi:hypothetical protein
MRHATAAFVLRVQSLIVAVVRTGSYESFPLSAIRILWLKGPKIITINVRKVTSMKAPSFMRITSPLHALVVGTCSLYGHLGTRRMIGPHCLSLVAHENWAKGRIANKQYKLHPGDEDSARVK